MMILLPSMKFQNYTLSNLLYLICFCKADQIKLIRPARYCCQLMYNKLLN